VVSREVGLDALVGEHQVAARLCSIEDQTVKTRRTVHNQVRQGSDLSHQRKVRGHYLEISVGYPAPNSVRRGVTSLGGTCAYQDLRTAFGELACYRLSHAACRAGDQKGGLVLCPAEVLSHRWLRFQPFRS
jgi:hypothetical protein